MTFYEVPEGQPQPVRAWFYPGDDMRAGVHSSSEPQSVDRAKHFHNYDYFPVS